MKVTRITLDTHNETPEGGFANPRLDKKLGLIDEGEGKRFAYAFQIAFELEGISGHDVKLKRRVTHKNEYPMGKLITEKKIVEQYGLKPLAQSDPSASEDSPNPQNIKREAHRVVVQDGPGPSFGLSDAKMYPLRFEGKFILMLKNATDGVLASVEYYVYLLKRKKDGNAEGGFELVKATIVPEPPPPPPWGTRR